MYAFSHLVTTGGYVDNADAIVRGGNKLGLVEVSNLRNLVLELGLERSITNGRAESGLDLGEGLTRRSRTGCGANG